MILHQRSPESSEAPLTAQGRRSLSSRARLLREEAIPRWSAALEDPDHNPDARENHLRAVQELAELDRLLARARPAELLPDDPQAIEVGEVVTVEFDDGSRDHFRIVHPVEARLGGIRIAWDSPLGQALLGRRIGDRVEVSAPGGIYRCTVRRSERPSQSAPRVCPG